MLFEASSSARGKEGGGGDALGGARRAASEAHENCDCDDDRGLCGSAYVGLKK